MAERKAEDRMTKSDEERRAVRKGRDAEGRPLRADETAPGERGDAPYGDAEKGGQPAPPTPPASRAKPSS